MTSFSESATLRDSRIVQPCDSTIALAIDADKVPKGWRVLRFDQVTTIGTGQVSPLMEPYGSYFYIGPENIESESGRILGLKTSKELGLISGKYLFDADAIIYSKIRPNLNN